MNCLKINKLYGFCVNYTVFASIIRRCWLKPTYSPRGNCARFARPKMLVQPNPVASDRGLRRQDWVSVPDFFFFHSKNIFFSAKLKCAKTCQKQVPGIA